MLKMHIFTLITLHFNAPRFEDWPAAFGAHKDNNGIVVPSWSTRPSAIAAFKHYHLRIAISGKSVTPKKAALPILVIGLSALSKFCHKIAMWPDPIYNNGLLIRDLHHVIHFNQAVIKPSAWDQRILLMPFVHTRHTIRATNDRRRVALDSGFSGSWWDYPHVTILGAEDQEQALKAEKLMRAPKWTSVKHFVQFVRRHYEESINRWHESDIFEANNIIAPLAELVYLTSLSRQGRAFRTGSDSELFYDAVAFFSYACPLTNCCILFVGAGTFLDPHGSAGTRMLTLAHSALRAITSHYGGNAPAAFSEFTGIALLYQAEAYRLMRKHESMKHSLSLARIELGVNYESYSKMAEENTIRVSLPQSIADQADIVLPDRDWLYE